MAPANTGRDNSNRKAVISTAHTNKGILNKRIPRHRINRMVTMKLIAPAIDEIPAICKLNIAKSTPGPEWLIAPDNGG